MKKLLLFFFLNVFLTGCSQTEKKPTVKGGYDIDQFIAPDAKDINANNYAEKVLQSIKHYKEEPIYYYRINKQNCLIEVKINDVVDYKDYELSNVITPTEIGHILKSGPQTVTVKMYPVGNLINEDLGLKNQPPSTTLSDKAAVEISVVMMDNRSDKQFKDEKLITKQVSPKEAAGKPYYEFSFTFDAQVPYEFEGWTKGQDLRKLDPKLVEKKAVEFYEMIGQTYINNNLADGLKFIYPSVLRTRQVLYRDSNTDKLLDEYRNEFIDHYTKSPIKNYKLNYMGDGKLLYLSAGSPDPEQNGGALMLHYGDNEVFQPEIILFLPEGRDLATQGFMMWT